MKTVSSESTTSGSHALDLRKLDRGQPLDDSLPELQKWSVRITPGFEKSGDRCLTAGPFVTPELLQVAAIQYLAYLED